MLSLLIGTLVLSTIITIYIISKGYLFNEELYNVLETIREAQSKYIERRSYDKIKYFHSFSIRDWYVIFVGVILWLFLIYLFVHSDPSSSFSLGLCIIISVFWGFFIYMLHDFYIGYDYPPRIILTSQGVVISYQWEEDSFTQFIAWENIMDVSHHFGYMKIDYLQGSSKTLLISYENMRCLNWQCSNLFDKYKKYWTY